MSQLSCYFLPTVLNFLSFQVLRNCGYERAILMLPFSGINLPVQSIWNICLYMFPNFPFQYIKPDCLAVWSLQSVDKWWCYVKHLLLFFCLFSLCNLDHNLKIQINKTMYNLQFSFLLLFIFPLHLANWHNICSWHNESDFACLFHTYHVF